MSIAEKLLRIAENEPKVYEAGKKGVIKDIEPVQIKSNIFQNELQTIANNTLEIYKIGQKSIKSKNLFNPYNGTKGSLIVSNGSINTGTEKYVMTTDFIPLSKGTYTISYKSGANLRYVCLFNGNKEVIGNFWSARNNPYTFTISEDCLVRIDIERANNVQIENYDTFFMDFECQLEIGNTATDYEPYK